MNVLNKALSNLLQDIAEEKIEETVRKKDFQHWDVYINGTDDDYDGIDDTRDFIIDEMVAAAKTAAEEAMGKTLKEYEKELFKTLFEADVAD